MLKSNLYGQSDAYIIIKVAIYLLATVANEDDKAKKNVAFKNDAPFRSCISKITSTLTDNAEDLDIVMTIYNLLKYSQNYSMISGNLSNCCRDEIDNDNDNASGGKLFK